MFEPMQKARKSIFCHLSDIETLVSSFSYLFLVKQAAHGLVTLSWNSTAKFLQKYKATENRICSLFGDEADRQLRSLCTVYKLQPSGSSASKIIQQIRKNFFSSL